MKDEVLDKKIKLWEDQLLDLGKRNRMISFRESKRTTLNILKPGFEDLYRLLVEEEKELTFQKAIDRDSDVRVYSILSLLDKMSCPMEVNIGDIRAQGALPEIRKTLKNLRSRAKLAMDEQGTHILYLVFGFIEWREKGGRGDNYIRSPLLLVPVTLSLPSLNAQYTLKKHEDEIVVNPTLAYLFERDYGITLPEFDSDKDTLDGFIEKMEQLVDDRGWRILRQCSMGLVSFLKISMYNDLLRNEEQLKANPILRAFAGERNAVNTVAEEDQAFDHDACKAVSSFQVLDADSSQLDAIMLSQKGVSFVMQGPPGTGKSQTITNIIAQALADGKKILFVSEKMAALDVVYRRLSDVHLADFCLSLHSHKANKKEILNQLGNNLNLQRIKVKDEEIAKLTRLDMIKEQLKAYVQDIHTTIMPLEMSLYEVYGAILELGRLPDIDLHLTNVDQLTKDDVNRLALLVQNLDRAQGVLGPQWYKNPWQGITGSYLEVSQKHDLHNKLRDGLRLLSALEGCKLNQKTLADLITLDKLDDFRDLCEHASHCRQVPGNWFFRPTDREERTARDLRETHNAISQIRTALLGRYHQGIFALDGAGVQSRFTNGINHCRNTLCHVSSDEEAFRRMEQDRRDLLHLQRLYEGVLQGIGKIADGCDLELDRTDASVDTALTLCDMLLEKRNLTPQYFGRENLQNLRRYVEEARQTAACRGEKRQRLISRCGADILELEDAEVLLRRLNVALEVITPLSRSGYSHLTQIGGLENIPMPQVQAVQSESAWKAVAQSYGFSPASNLHQVDRQLKCLASLAELPVIDRWQNPSDRAAARRLLQNAADRTTALESRKESLKAFFRSAGICLDPETMTADDLHLLCSMGQNIPELDILTVTSGQPKAWQLLQTMEQNKEELETLGRSIGDLRKVYHVRPEVDNRRLREVLMESCAVASSFKPSLALADEPDTVYNLLIQMRDLDKNLQQQRAQFALKWEDTVYDLDYTAMLNRFKGDYNNFLKVFKASYQEDLRQVRLQSREVRKKISDEEIIALLQSLRKYHEDLNQYRSLSTRAEELLSVSDYDVCHDWDTVQKRLDAFRALCGVFANGRDAHGFVSDGSWDKVLTNLARYEMLNGWFRNNEPATAYFSRMYKGAQTDTQQLRTILEQIKTNCSLFASPEQYLEFARRSQSAVQSDLRLGELLLEDRAWFAGHALELRELAGAADQQENTCWTKALDNLEQYETLCSLFSEKAAWAFTADKDSKELNDYRTALQTLASLEDRAKKLFCVDELDESRMTMELGELVSSMEIWLDQVREAAAVYEAVEKTCPRLLNGVSMEELQQDLQDVVFCQEAAGQLTRLDKEAHGIIGPDYTGESTDWGRVLSNIVFAEKLHHLCGGAVPQKLVTAVMEGTSPCTPVERAELGQHWQQIKTLLQSYPQIGYLDTLPEKIQTLSGVLDGLNAAIDSSNALTQYAYGECGYEDFTEDLHRLMRLQSLERNLTRDFVNAKKILPMLNDEPDGYDALVEQFDHLRHVKRAIGAGGLDEELVSWLTNSMEGTKVDTYYQDVVKLHRCKQWFTDVTVLFENPALLEGYDLTKLGKRLRRCEEQFSTMDAWIDLRDCRKACRENGLGDFIEKAEDAYYPEDGLKDVFLKSFYYQWFEKTCAGIESVANFRVRTQQTRVEDFRRLDAHQLPVDQMRIRERLIRDMPTRNNFGRATDEMSVLLHELNKKRNIMPLRKLFRAIPHLLLKLKPCLMMSPLSVSYFLEAQTYQFDMVIFDEASQIFPQDAIGAIFRGKQVIITGDSKQLPPTNFFAASTNNETEFDVDEEADVDVVYDSILEEAGNSLPNRSLLWHYRSRYEDLISFSNREIYQNDLITFPSSTVGLPDTGVEYIHVKDGVYEKRCNRGEAKKIVLMVAEHIRKYPDRSLGIIAFSESQQSLIEDEIHQFRMKNPFYEGFFSEDREEPFFVKNLENVQGDERDTIIFSICYGKNAQGRMYMRFGPLGQQGGERRLNVAITRAKHNVKLVGSIWPEDIDLSKTQSQGARMLRDYISFAMKGSDALAKHEKNSLYDEDTFSRQVGQFLRSRGCKVQMNVGNSDYTVDIAVEHPGFPGRYVAGIECDGNAYYMARTVRDREHLRTAVLERMGWRMYRVWSTEWIRNPEAEQNRLMEFIRQAFLQNEQKELPAQSGGDTPSVATEVIRPDYAANLRDAINPYDLPLYEEGKWWDITTRRGTDNQDRIADMIHAVVAVEQPMHIELLYKRVGQGFTTGKATQAVRSTVDQVIAQRMAGEVVVEDSFVRLADFTQVQARRSSMGRPNRNIEHISIAEIAAAMEKILYGAFGMERSVLCSEAAKVFGYERIGPRIRSRTNEAVDYLEHTHKVTVCDEKVQLREER